MSRSRSTSHARDARRPSDRRRLSQNFLVDPAVARRIVRASGIGGADLVVEVGAGDGMLTRHLTAAREILAYERDGRYVDRLRRRFAGDDRVRCLHADIRDVRPPREPFALVSNVPYSITTDIVRWCLAARSLHSATLVTQLEFARKHSGDFGRWTRLAVTHWPTWDIALGERIGRQKFRPVPRVDSAVLHLNRRTEPLLSPRESGEYRRLVELGFTGAGGSLPASLRRAYPSRTVERARAAAGIPRGVPVGHVSPEQWIALYRALR
ncbi:23S rRNA (adenine(2058)-N(6))-methyltransferase Erm(O) [Glycomyces halotolerans]